MRSFYAFALIAVASCAKKEPSSSNGAATSTSKESPSVASSVAEETKSAPSVVTVAIGGDLLPHTNVLKNAVADVFAGAPSIWRSADVRIANLEAPVGDPAKADRVHLVYTSPPSWFDALVDDAKVTAFAAANNHACDVGLQGLEDTVHAARAKNVGMAGIATDDPWAPAKIATASGRVICLVSWTSVLNETAGPRFDACMKGDDDARLAYAAMSAEGVARVHAELGQKDRWAGCDARIAYFHGGVEYHPQGAQILALAEAAAAYVDVVAIAHPHVPDGVASIEAPKPIDGADVGDRAIGRAVPVFRSLGNFVSNQGYAWSLGQSTGVVASNEGGVDMLRTVWTRVAMIGRVEFTFAAGAPPASAPIHVRYGYALADVDHRGADLSEIRLRPIAAPADDPIAAALENAPIPWTWLIKDRCRVTDSATPWCEAR